VNVLSPPATVSGMGQMTRPLVVARVLAPYLAILLVAIAAVSALATVVVVKIVRDQTEHTARSRAEATSSQVVGPLVNHRAFDGDIQALRLLDEQVRAGKVGSDIQRITVWSAQGVILYSDDARQIGLTYPLMSADRAVLDGGRVESAVVDMAQSPRVLDWRLGQSLEVSVGSRDAAGQPVLVKTYFAESSLRADESSLVWRIMPVTIAAVTALGLLLVLPLALSVATRTERIHVPR
jgi:two-component system NarL family sensor kinase